MLGMVSPWFALHTPFGPSKTAVFPLTSRITHPAMVVGLVSATAVGLDKSVRTTAVRWGLCSLFCERGLYVLNAAF